MANKPTSMSKVRQILKMHSQGIGKKKIAARLLMSKNTVKLYIEKYFQLQTTLDELLKLTDYELDKRFHPPHEIILDSRVQQLHDYYPQMEKELRKWGVTVAKLFRKFKEENPDGLAETSFYHYYRLWKKKFNVSIHIEQKAGDKTYIDYAGATLPYVDEDTGEVLYAYSKKVINLTNQQLFFKSIHMRISLILLLLFTTAISKRSFGQVGYNGAFARYEITQKTHFACLGYKWFDEGSAKTNHQHILSGDIGFGSNSLGLITMSSISYDYLWQGIIMIGVRSSAMLNKSTPGYFVSPRAGLSIGGLLDLGYSYNIPLSTNEMGKRYSGSSFFVSMVLSKNSIIATPEKR